MILERVQEMLTAENIRYRKIEHGLETFVRCGSLGARLEIEQRQNVLRVLILTGIFAPEQRRTATMEAVARANYNLPLGCFEMDVTDGEVRCRGSLPIRDVESVPEPMLQAVVFGTWSVCSRYVDALMQVTMARMEPAFAIAYAESAAVGRGPIVATAEATKAVN
jgi:hypothetical protein